MSVYRSKKEVLVQELHERFLNSEAVLIAHNHGLTVDEFTNIRRKMREQNARLHVAKNTIARIAVRGTRYEGLLDFLKGPVNITFANDPVSVSKSAVQFAKAHEKFVIVAGAIGEQVFDEKQVKALSELPSLETLRGKIVGLLQAPAAKLIRVLQAPAQNVVGVLASAAKDWDAVTKKSSS